MHSADFRNSRVDVAGTGCADPQLSSAGVTALPLHEGSFQFGQYRFELVGDVKYGDVSDHTGNDTEKAVFVGSCSSAGKTSQVLFVYGMADGKLARLATTDLSGQGNALVQSYSVNDGTIRVEANEGTPPSLVTLSYALLNKSLVNLNPSAPTAPPVETAENSDESAPPGARAAISDDRIDFQTFHDALSPYGAWTQDRRWGAVWHPTQVPANFAPYRQGHWEDTGEYGTVWVSDYNWGDIAFHYGRWGYDPGRGWVWQPGYVWSPAWVAWRQGNGDIGWLPIPPDYYNGTGTFADDEDDWYGYRALYGAEMDAAAYDALWNFVPADDIYAPSIGVDIIAPALYVSFIGRTVGWTRFGVVRGHLFNRAISAARFRSAFHHSLPVGARHDFLAHHVPVTDVRRGHLIAAHEAALGHRSSPSYSPQLRKMSDGCSGKPQFDS